MAARPAWCDHRRQETRRHQPKATAALTPEPFELQPFAQEPAGDRGGARAGVDDLMQVAVVVDVVADKHPMHVVGFDDREQVVEVLVSVDRAPRVDDDWLASADHIEFMWALSGLNVLPHVAWITAFTVRRSPVDIEEVNDFDA